MYSPYTFAGGLYFQLSRERWAWNHYRIAPLHFMESKGELRGQISQVGEISGVLSIICCYYDDTLRRK
jgi:hypothetical protein